MARPADSAALYEVKGVSTVRVPALIEVPDKEAVKEGEAWAWA
jgi:hypothetical protein